MKIVYYTSYFGSAEQSINPNSLKYFTFSKNKTANLFFAHEITSIGTSKTAADLMETEHVIQKLAKNFQIGELSKQ